MRHLMRYLLSAWILLSVACGSLSRQAIGQTADGFRSSQVVVLPGHHPEWANKSNDSGLLPAATPIEHLTLVLSRSPEQEAALQQLLADQQDPNSQQYHHWLSPAQVGERFGPSADRVTAVSNWLQSQSLHVDWVSPSRMFIGFGGTAGAIGRAFQTEPHTYKTNGIRRMSVASDPAIPQALGPAIQSIHGLYTMEDRPYHAMSIRRSDAPDTTTTTGVHVLAPSDFATIYDYDPPGATGNTIGIVGRSRTDFSDFENFRKLTGSGFPNPTEIVPTAFGGIDPGPALTAPPTGSVSIGDQSEATLDVMRAGSIGYGAALLLVVSTEASGGIEADAQYLVETSPLPAQVMSISFGACESSAGPSGVAFWDTLFQQAAAEGISVLVSSGDSGASGCDEAFTTPPGTPQANSPNYICSSSYATCVGGTEFNEGSNPAQYWNASNNNLLGSALSYIPEGGWNEPLNTASAPQVAASGGGVSSVIATPAWQTGTGVPAARTGRYTPDIAFSAADHDGYFACFAAGGANCVVDASGSFAFAVFSGTSATAPSMAGVTSTLGGYYQAGQGNLNPQLYQMAARAPTVFHDVTVASSGVTGCALATPSLCNNSISGPIALSGGQPGFPVTPGYDEVTGLGSLDINEFFRNFEAPPEIYIATSPASLTFSSQLVGFSTSREVDFQSISSTPLDPLAITITGPNASDFTLVNHCQLTLTVNVTCAANVTFAPSAAGTRTATMTVTSSNAGNSPRVVPITGTGSTTLFTPSMIVSTDSNSITTAQGLTVTVLVDYVNGVPTDAGGQPIRPTGTITLTGGGYNSGPVLQNAYQTVFNIPAGKLSLGQTDVLTATYTPDSTSSAIYTGASGTTFVTVTPVPTPGFTLDAANISTVPGATTSNTSTISITSVAGFTGSVTFSAAIASGPANYKEPPTLSFGTTSPANLTTNGGQATLTVSTTAPTINAQPTRPTQLSWYAGGGLSVALLLLFHTPARLRRWRALLGAVCLFVVFAGGILACGGGGASGSPGHAGVTDPGTTNGNYTVMITGTAGSASATTTVTIEVR